MTTIDLYRKHKAGEISREKFLYEVRRDNNLPFITNLTSYDDAVKILKNKGIVTEVDTKEAKTAESVKAEVKPKKTTEPKLKELHIDQANPYEYRHGLSHELDQLDDYSAESLEKAKATVLKNLAKDANFYSSLLNQQQSPFSFKTPESQDEKLAKKLDSGGRLPIKGITKEKANVKDNLGKKEEGTTKPKDVKVMSDKGVTGSEKTIKEGFNKIKEALKSALKKKVTEDNAANELAKKSAIQTEKAKILALNKQKSELNADTTKPPTIKQKEKEEIDLKLKTANDTLSKLNQGKINVV